MLYTEYLDSAVQSYLWKYKMFQAFVRQATSAYHPLPSLLPGEPEVRYKGKLVHETQLNCFYIQPGGKTPLYCDVSNDILKSIVMYSIPIETDQSILYLKEL